MPTNRARRLLSILGPEFTINDVVSKINVSYQTAKKYVYEMIKEGFVNKVEDNKFIVTEKGLFLIEGENIAKKGVEDKYAYIFTDEKGMPLPTKIDNIEKLYAILRYKIVPDNIIMHHVEKGYLVKWILEQLGARILAQKLQETKSPSELLKLLEEYIGTD
ncbi:MAG: winged helix-turn-helix domain-containing protein [Desulfurococcaceae archaeon]